jgi:ribosomal protein S18 acetylase RimI-like enzyme
LPVEPTSVGGERRFPVTELGPDAAGELGALSSTAYPLTAGPDQKPTAGQVAAELADPDVMTLGVRELVAGRPLVAAACVRVNPDDRGVADVARLVVAPGRRRPGLGSLLLRAVEHRLPVQVRELWLQINPTDEYSRRLYAQHGYRQAAHDRAAGNHTADLVKPRRRGARRSAQ